MSQRGNNPYGYYGVYGSLAYDFRPIGVEMPGTYSGKTAHKQNRKKKCKAGVSPALAVSCALCAVFLYCAVMWQSQLIVISNEVSILRGEISELISEQSVLKIKHTAAFSPEDTERYAIEVLGMRKPGADQIIYIEVPQPITAD